MRKLIGETILSPFSSQITTVKISSLQIASCGDRTGHSGCPKDVAALQTELSP